VIRRSMKIAAGVAMFALLVGMAGCTKSSGGGSGGLVVGVSNTVSGNGWRETMICSIKAEAVASGKVSKVIVVSKNGGPTEQIQDLQNLISQGVNILIVNPSDPEKLNDVIKEATSRGIIVVAVDSSVTAPTAYVVTNDQTKLGELSMQWIADYMGGKGTFLYMRGAQGVQADTDRDNGVQSVLKKYPDLKYKEVFTDWDYTKAGQLATQEFSAADYAAVWTSGQDYTVVNAIKATGKPPVPVLGEETNEFVNQLINGTPGALVTNPAIVGGAGLNVALKIQSGQKPGDRVVLLTPQLMDAKNNMNDLKAMYDPKLDATASVSLSIPGYTTFTADQLRSCKGPGE